MSGAAETKPSGGSSFFWLVYGQIAAMLGAFSFLVFLTHFLDLGLKGVIREAFDGWVQYVRPIVGYPLQWLISFLPEGWRFEMPALIKDYFGVGLVTALSGLRAAYQTRADLKAPTVGFVDGLLMVFIWPLAVLVSVFMLFDQDESSTFQLMVLAPLIYLGLLFAANAWLPA